jgi:hypothetical protein
MNWFTYLIQTPWAQKKQDWAEFKNLKQDLKSAKVDLFNKERSLEHTFFEEESYDEYDACLKRRLMYVRVKPIDAPSYEQELMVFHPSRCRNFAPIGDEKPCVCYQCGAYAKNKEYFDAKQTLKELTDTQKNFWKNKFKQKIK